MPLAADEAEQHPHAPECPSPRRLGYGPAVLPEAVALLRCPHCGAGLALAGAAVRCPAGHAFDVARQGYVSLLAGPRAAPGDDAAMVAARAAFLGAGHYAPLTESIVAAAAAALADGPPGCVADLGAGTGHHLAAVLDHAPGRLGLALDASAPALRRAARAHPRMAAVGCDAWRAVPVRSGVVALALSVFAPRNGAELARVIAPGGGLLVAAPEPDHLAELVGPLGLLRVDERKAERVAAQLEPAFAPISETAVRAPLALGAADVGALVAMGPSAHHVDPAAVRERVAAPVAATLAVRLTAYRRA
jgi:23S rRNA (guanine745-N1)-methyltransferase